MKRFAAIKAYLRRDSGAAATELAIWLSVLTLPFLNVIDFGLYLYQRIQVENAAQLSVQAAWQAWPSCTGSISSTPTATTCTALIDAAQQAGHSTNLGVNVTIPTPTVGKFCVVSGALSADCDPPATAIYVQIAATKAYAPLFGAVSIGSQFGSSIARTAWMRVA